MFSELQLLFPCFHASAELWAQEAIMFHYVLSHANIGSFVHFAHIQNGFLQNTIIIIIIIIII